jgi:hypothetical protein
MATMSFYQQLDDALVMCSLGDQSQDFLPLSELNEKITKDSVRAQLSYTTLWCRPGLPEKVCQYAKKVFAILVLIGEPSAIRDLIADGLTDEHLPLSRNSGKEKNILLSVKGQRFSSFAAWPHEARVKAFLEKQWVVQAPVLDMTGKHIVLDRKCALPFRTSDDISGAGSSVVYKGILHPAHQEGFEVSVAWTHLP